MFTLAYEQWQTMRYKVGDITNISYKEEPKTFVNGQGKTINFNQKTIIGFRETNDMPEQTKPIQAPTTPQRSNSSVTEPRDTQDAFGRRLAIHGFMNALLASGKTTIQARQVIPELLELEDAINEALAGKTDDPFEGIGEPF